MFQVAWKNLRPVAQVDKFGQIITRNVAKVLNDPGWYPVIASCYFWLQSIYQFLDRLWCFLFKIEAWGSVELEVEGDTQFILNRFANLCEIFVEVVCCCFIYFIW